jgi:hypothetical protein
MIALRKLLILRRLAERGLEGRTTLIQAIAYRTKRGQHE